MYLAKGRNLSLPRPRKAIRNGNAIQKIINKPSNCISRKNYTSKYFNDQFVDQELELLVGYHVSARSVQRKRVTLRQNKSCYQAGATPGDGDVLLLAIQTMMVQ